jgi:plastocyanin
LTSRTLGLARICLFALAAVTAGCSGGGAASSATPPPDVEASIDAKDSRFTSAQLTVPGGVEFQLFFRNLDGIPHNVAIYRDPTAVEKLFVGETITNATVTYVVPAMPAGAYFFRCDLHPDMSGTVQAA